MTRRTLTLAPTSQFLCVTATSTTICPACEILRVACTHMVPLMSQRQVDALSSVPKRNRGVR